MLQILENAKEYILEHLPSDANASACINLEELIIDVEAHSIISVLIFLRDDPKCLFQQLVDICGVDYLQRAERFEIIYNLLSLKYNMRVRVRIKASEETQIPSSIAVFSAANWLEREVWDMYGILFAEHPDLRRILTDYGFVGHPQRKDFPLTGYVEVSYDEEKKAVVYSPVKLQQEFRNFDFSSPWEYNAEYISLAAKVV